MTAAIIVVGLYSLGLRMLIRGGRVPVVAPAEFTDAITVMTPAEARKAEKKAIKAAKKNPLTEGQKRFSRAIAYLCFALCAGAVLAGIYLIVPALHGG
ncbi:MAG: peptidase [Mycetocola sp.]